MKDWNARVGAAIEAQEKKNWLEEIDQKPKLRTYKKLKKKLELEDYIEQNRMSEGRRLLTAMRSGTNGLRIETCRHYEWTIPEEERTCWCCGDQVENEQHFVVQCKHYRTEREEMFCMIEAVTEGRSKAECLRSTQPEVLFNFLIGNGAQHKRAEVMKCVQTFLVRATKSRKEFCKRAGIMPRSRGG